MSLLQELNHRYLQLHTAKEDAFWAAKMGLAGSTEGDFEAKEIRLKEYISDASHIARVRAEGWSVGDGRDPATGDARWRPARLGDITVLVPARTSLPFLEDALERSAIPYRAESSSLVYVSRAVRDLLMCARAVDDPTDHLAVVSALRSPLNDPGSSPARR